MTVTYLKLKCQEDSALQLSTEMDNWKENPQQHLLFFFFL